MSSGRKWMKIISAWVLYVLLHFANKLMPSPVCSFFGCPEETLYTHMKMAFFSYLIINIIFGLVDLGQKRKPAVFAQMLSNSVYPYLAFFIWMIVPALFGQIHTPALEVVYSNVILVICLYMTVTMEGMFSQAVWSKSAKVVAVFFFAVSCVLYTAMTINKPGIELFEYHSHGEEVHQEK